MRPFNFPNRHMFIPTSYKLSVVIRIELNIKYWESASISEAESTILFPLKYLQWKGFVHSNGNQEISISRKCKIQYSSFMRGL